MWTLETFDGISFSVLGGRRFNLADVSFADIRYRVGTGRAHTEKDGHGKKTCHYRVGVSTPIGDIEESVWYQVANALIEREGETELFSQLKDWVKDHIAWVRTKDEISQYAMRLHVNRIFDDPEWVDFLPFNKKYRPEALDGVETVFVKTECCALPGNVTAAQVKRAYDGLVCCPHCGRFSAFELEKVHLFERTI